MKNYYIKFPLVVLLLLLVLSACKKEPMQGVSIDRTLLVNVGETVTLKPTFVPANAHNKNVSWESADPNVATVENGKVTGITIGKVIIKVITEDGGRTATCLVFVVQPIEPEEMIWVEGGTYMMGCNDDECFDNELPRHEVSISGFYISKYAVTQKEWIAALGEILSEHNGDNIPVHFLSWDDTQSYINKLNAYTGKNYRLPTEAEWEYAARGGNKSQGFKYSGSDSIGEVAVYSTTRPRPVGQKKPNELGIYDMSGNMFEWCSDYFGYYSDVSQTNPTGPATGSERIVRGGAYYLSARYARVSCRLSVSPDQIYSVGFRLVHP
jgi:hypothetical protein